MREVPTNEYLDAITQLLRDGHEAVIPVKGSSMAPFLRGGKDRVKLKSVTETPKRGDVVLFQRNDGHYILHRIMKQTDRGYMILGDAQTDREGPVPEERVIAVVSEIEHHGKWQGKYSLRWLFYRYIWIATVSFRPFLFRTAEKLKKAKKISGS